MFLVTETSEEALFPTYFSLNFTANNWEPLGGYYRVVVR